MRKAQNHSVVGHVGAAVTILGSLLMPAAAGAQVPERPTFAKDVAPIFQEKCQACHRPGQMGPMPLVTYQEVRPWVRVDPNEGLDADDAAVASRQDRRHPEVQERHLADRRSDRDHRPLGGSGRSARRSE